MQHSTDYEFLSGCGCDSNPVVTSSAVKLRRWYPLLMVAAVLLGAILLTKVFK